MENTFFQYLGKLRKKEKPEIDNLSREELILLIESLMDYKDQTISFIKSSFTATQQSRADSISTKKYKNGPYSFQILEGLVTYHPRSKTYTIEFNDTLKKMFEKNDLTGQTRLKSILISRFYKIIEASFRAESEIIINNKNNKK